RHDHMGVLSVVLVMILRLISRSESTPIIEAIMASFFWATQGPTIRLLKQTSWNILSPDDFRAKASS
ncbi:hypothetical protein, partial [Pseudomonas syringae]|uniref:hypothetical protein n=1 Tax=Pseudomonas syringae TaxID=317 RepID=UPI001F1B6F12